MKVVFPNSAHVPAPERFILKGGRWRQVQVPVRYGLVLHPTEGPVMIDTGYTHHALEGAGRSLALRIYGRALRVRARQQAGPEHVLASHGYTVDDVQTVIVTHFHADHVAGLKQFPNARFVADRDAYREVEKNGNWQNVRQGIFPELLPADFADRLVDLRDGRFDAQLGAFDIFDDGLILAKPLPGHAAGHFGVLFPTQKPRLIYAVDAQWMVKALAPDKAPSGPARLICHDAAEWLTSAALVRRLSHEGWDVVLCHDPDPTPYGLGKEAP